MNAPGFQLQTKKLCLKTYTLIGKLTIAWESALSVWMLRTGWSPAVTQLHAV